MNDAVPHSNKHSTHMHKRTAQHVKRLLCLRLVCADAAEHRVERRARFAAAAAADDDDDAFVSARVCLQLRMAALEQAQLEQSHACLFAVSFTPR